MTLIATSTIDPDEYCRAHGCPRATCDESHPATILDTEDLIAELRATGRLELIHYAGAAHHDPVAWHICAAYLADRTADEATLKSRALKAAHGWDVSPEQLRCQR